jgi:hypothetical protein
MQFTALIGQPKERAMKRQSRRTLCAAGLIILDNMLGNDLEQHIPGHLNNLARAVAPEQATIHVEQVRTLDDGIAQRAGVGDRIRAAWG